MSDMSDTEWASWQRKWSGGEGPLPDIRGRARQETRSSRLAAIAFFFLIAAGLAGSVKALMDPRARIAGVTAVAFCVSMLIGYVAIRRGVGARADDGPREALGFLERRLRAEQRIAHLVRWAYLGLCVAGILMFPLMVRNHSHPGVEIVLSVTGMVFVAIVTFTAPWWVARRNRRHQDEITRWKRWLDEQQL